MKGRRVAAVGFALAGCGGASVDGGYTVAEGREPEGRLLARYERVECVDAASKPFPARVERVDVLSQPPEDEDSGPRFVLVERRRGLDSLVAEAAAPDVFRVSTESARGDEWHREYRIPRSAGEATLVVSDERGAVVLRCTLARDG